MPKWKGVAEYREELKRNGWELQSSERKWKREASNGKGKDEHITEKEKHGVEERGPEKEEQGAEAKRWEKKNLDETRDGQAQNRVETEKRRLESH